MDDELLEAEAAKRDLMVTQAEQLIGAGRLRKLQEKMIGIQTGTEPPPEWFQRTGFDTAQLVVSYDREDPIVFELIAASAGTMEALDRANNRTELQCEQNAIIEAIALIPEEYKLRRPFKSSVGNKTYEADTHFKNLWDEYAKNDKLAREILSQLIGGKLYTMLKMAVMWLSKVTLTDMVALDPEDSDERRPPD